MDAVGSSTSVADRASSRFGSPISSGSGRLDPDTGMLEEARRAARERKVMNVSWVLLRAEDLPAGLGTFQGHHVCPVLSLDGPTQGGRRRTGHGGAERGRGPDRPGPRRHSRPSPPGPYPAVPLDGIDRLRRHYLGPDRRAGQGFRNTSPSGEDAIFQAAGFLPEVQLRVADRRVFDRSTDDLVAWVFSTSSTAPHLFGDDLGRFESDLRALLDETSPSGHFSVPLSDTALRIRRPNRHADPEGPPTHR